MDSLDLRLADIGDALLQRVTIAQSPEECRLAIEAALFQAALAGGLAKPASSSSPAASSADPRARIALRLEILLRDDDSNADRAQLGEVVAALLRGDGVRQQLPEPNGADAVARAELAQLRDGVADLASRMDRAVGTLQDRDPGASKVAARAAVLARTLLSGTPMDEDITVDGQEGG